MPEDTPTPPKVDTLAALGPLVELVAKGGAGALAVIVLAWQVYTGTTSIQARIETLDTSMRTEIGGLATQSASGTSAKNGQQHRRQRLADDSRCPACDGGSVHGGDAGRCAGPLDRG